MFVCLLNVVCLLCLLSVFCCLFSLAGLIVCLLCLLLVRCFVFGLFVVVADRFFFHLLFYCDLLFVCCGC